MAVFRVNATREGRLAPVSAGTGWREGLARSLDALPERAPVTVLLHGFRFTWRAEVARGDHCPQTGLYGAEPVEACARRRPTRAAWAHELGFSAADPADGLCIAFGWEGRLPGPMGGIAGFRAACRSADRAGEALAQLSAEMRALRPDLTLDILAHSLGARVALSAAAVGARPGRMVLLGAAEWRARAAAALDEARRHGPAPDCVHVMSRANDLYDALFQIFAPGTAGPEDRPLGSAGIGADVPGWIDVQLDLPALRPWLAGRGYGLMRPREAVSHWHFYADRGAMAFYRAILRRHPGTSVAALRAAGLPERIEPRWCRIAPRLAAAGAEAMDEPGLLSRG